MQLQTTGQRPDFGVALATLLDAQSQFKMLSYSSRFFPYAGETHRNVLKFLWESPASNSTSSSDGWYEIPHVPCPRLWFLCCLQPGWMRSKGWPSSQPCPCRSKLSWSQRMESSDLSHEGLVTKPRTHLPSTRAMEPSTNQCPSIPTPHGRGWSVNKNQTFGSVAISVFAKLLAVLQCAKEFVTELYILERWIHSDPLGKRP